MKRILLLMGIVPILMSLASCGKKENVTVEETTEEWPSLYADKDMSAITATVYNTTGFFDDYKTDEHAYYKRRNYKTGEKRIVGSDENALRLIFMYDIPTTQDAWNLYMQSSTEEYRYMNECINKAVIEIKAEYQDGSTGTDYYRIELYNQYSTGRINIYKLSEE